MGQFFSDLLHFIYAILTYWQAYLTGGLITGVIGLFERLSNYRLTKRAYVAVFICTFLFISFFLAWRDEHIAKTDTANHLQQQITELQNQLNIERDQNTIKLKGLIIYAGTGNSPNPARRDMTAVILTVQLSNEGAPSIATAFDLQADIKGRGTIHGEQILIPYKGMSLKGERGERFEISADDMLYVKAVQQPIVKGIQVSGALAFVLKGISKDEVENAGGTFVLNFQDYKGTRFTTPPIPIPGRSAGGNFGYLPGMKPPKTVGLPR